MLQSSFLSFLLSNFNDNDQMKKTIQQLYILRKYDYNLLHRQPAVQNNTHLTSSKSSLWRPRMATA